MRSLGERRNPHFMRPGVAIYGYSSGMLSGSDNTEYNSVWLWSNTYWQLS